MRIFSLTSLASVLLAALTFTAAHADTINFVSAPGVTTYKYISGYGALNGTSGSAVATSIYGASPIAGGQWVSTDANGGNGGLGVINYTNTFTLVAGRSYSGTFTFMADDYAGVMVNGVEILPIGSSPSYYSPTTINLLPSYFTAGVNTISLEVRNNGGITGADFAGTVTGVTPEPSTLLLLGTGVVGAAAAARRRFFTA